MNADQYMTLRESLVKASQNEDARIETPATIIKQINYTGTTNIVAPRIEINRNLGNRQRDNMNDLDDYYHM